MDLPNDAGWISRTFDKIGRETETILGNQNQLESVEQPGDWKTIYRYDGLQRLRQVSRYQWRNSQWNPEEVRRYVYDGRQIIQEQDGENTLLVTYTRGLDLSGTLGGAGGIGGMLAYTDHSTGVDRTAYYHADGNGNITAMINGVGRVVARYHYDPYGNLLGMAGPLSQENRYCYSSKEIQPYTDLYHYGYRFYDPSLQRWINQDPIGEAGGVNLYEFVGNDPVNQVDLFGLQAGPFGPTDSRWKTNPGADYAPPTFNQPLDAAKYFVGSAAWAKWSLFPPNWIGKPRCNKFVWDCHLLCPSVPDPTKATKNGEIIYPTVVDVQDPEVEIPGYGTPHRGPFKSGDIVTDGVSHMGIVDENGVIQASSRLGIVFLAKPGTAMGTFDPVWGRSPKKRERETK